MKLQPKCALTYTLRAASRRATSSRSAAGIHSLLCPKTKSYFSTCVPSHSHRDTHSSSAIMLILLRKSLILLALTNLKGLAKEWDTEIRNQTQGRHQHLQRNNYSKVIPSHKVANDMGEGTLMYLSHCTAHTWFFSASYVHLNTV